MSGHADRHSFVLTHREDAAVVGGAAASGGVPLSPAVLLDNLAWFVRLRWLVAGVLVVLGFWSIMPRSPGAVLAAPSVASLHGAATLLVVANICFALHARRLRRAPDVARLHRALWAQIGVDLMVLTLVVQDIGSLETFAPCAYILHIVLSCIFFPRRESLMVTCLAIALYAGCIGAEQAGWLPTSGIFAPHGVRVRLAGVPGLAVVQVAIMSGVWLSAWYLASRLTVMVRERDAELAARNRQLERTQREKTQHMLRTTHELKAPFAAVHANCQLLLGGYCGELPSAAGDVVARIAARCDGLAAEIQEMLQLANLTSGEEGGHTVAGMERLDLAAVMRYCLRQLEAVAAERQVRLAADIQPAAVIGIPDHLKMLVGNLVGNAVTYSQAGGEVTVRCAVNDVGRAVLTVCDQGIGIAADKLPRIFADYYRADEAVRHNTQSSGLGLAIVRRVARTHDILIQVESAVGEGTTFTATFPPAAAPEDARQTEGDESDGSLADR